MSGKTKAKGKVKNGPGQKTGLRTRDLPPKPSPKMVKDTARPLDPEPADRLPNPVRKSHRALVERLCMDGDVLPLEVMVGNMRFAHAKAHVLLGKLIEKLNQDAPLTDEEKIVAVDDYRESLRWRDTAQSCARDAAPYLHPRLASIEIKDDSTKTITMVRRVIIDSAGSNPGDADTEEVGPIP